MSIVPAPDNHNSSLFAQFHLTRRECEALHWIMEGKRDGEIARIMGVSLRTAEHHVGSVLHKLCVETRTAAARIALDIQPNGRGQ
jgi:DNA-binding CsgD family transcriptional regulator